MPTIYSQITETELDASTGEINMKRETVAVRHGEEPPYIKLYLRDILYLSDLPMALSALTHELLKYATFAGEGDGMVIVFSPYIKERISKTLGYKSKQAINNGISKLLKGHILYRLGTSTYQFNPYLFGKGNWADINNIRMSINYGDIDNRTFSTVIKYNSDVESNNESKED